MEFMTNADTPALAVEGIITDAKNPFTGVPLAPVDKTEFIKILTHPPESTRIKNKTQFSAKKDEWLTVKDNIYESENWKPYTDIE